MPLSGFGGSASSFASDDPFSTKEGPPQNFQLYRYTRTYVFYASWISREFICWQIRDDCYAICIQILILANVLLPIPMISAANICYPKTPNLTTFDLCSWETYQPVSGLLAQPEWTVWDQTVEYCAFAYQQYIVISSLRPQFRYLGDVSIPFATGAVWHRRQLFVATPTTIE
jgi:hypothetical protein